MFANHEKLAASHRHQSRERRESEEPLRREVEESQRPRAAVAGLVFKRHTPEAGEESKTAIVTPPNVAPNETQAWWQWTLAHLRHQKSEIESDYLNRYEILHAAIGEALGMKCREVRDGVEREINFVKREIEQLREVADSEAKLHRERETLWAKAADAERALYQSELESLRREVALLRGELGVHRGLAALHDEVAAARSEVPKFDELKARVAAQQTKLRSEQRSLERELVATQARLSKVRVAQSASDYRLTEHIRAQQPVVELKFECAASQFTMRDLHPDAAVAWRRFVAEMVAANDCYMSTNDPTGRVVALPSRQAGAA
jgi:hypothetical protein